jgi:hypothetical protein
MGQIQIVHEIIEVNIKEPLNVVVKIKLFGIFEILEEVILA